jgi:hypothetical protein
MHNSLLNFHSVFLRHPVEHWDDNPANTITLWQCFYNVRLTLWKRSAKTLWQHEFVDSRKNVVTFLYSVVEMLLERCKKWQNIEGKLSSTKYKYYSYNIKQKFSDLTSTICRHSQIKTFYYTIYVGHVYNTITVRPDFSVQIKGLQVSPRILKNKLFKISLTDRFVICTIRN